MLRPSLASVAFLASLLLAIGSARTSRAQEPPEGATSSEPTLETAPESAANPATSTADSRADSAETEAAEPPTTTTLQVVERPVVGSVVGHRDNDAIVDIGENVGVSLGARIEFFRVTPVDLGDGEIAFERESIAIGEVSALTGRRALVRLGVNESVPEGAQAALVSAPSPSASARNPPRIGGVWEISGDARVFAVSSAVGAGFLGGGYVGYRGERPFFVRVRVDPSGFTVHRTDPSQPIRSATSLGAMVLAGFDQRYFGFGAGFGVTRAIPLHGEFCTGSTSTRSCEQRTEHAHAGFSFGLHARIGTYDGLSISVDTAFTTVRQKSELSLLDVRALIPATDRLAILFRGGSGFHVSGANWVDLGARMLTRGDGGRGSIYVAPYLGWARLTGSIIGSFDRYDPSQPYDSFNVGPQGKRSGASAGVTVEYRL